MNINLGNDYSISVETNEVNKSVSIAICKGGEWIQDIALVERVKGAILNDAVAVYVWGNEKDDNFTHRITIPFAETRD